MSKLTSTETPQGKSTTSGNARAAETIMRWRALPEVVAYCDYKAPTATTWEAFREDALNGGLTWAVQNRQARWHFAAWHPEHVLGPSADAFAEDDLAIIRQAHSDEGAMIDPTESLWLVVEDTQATSPADLPAAFDDAKGERNPAYTAAATAWATDYRARLPEDLRHLGMVVLPEPGERPIIGLWLGVARPAEVLRKWIGRVGGGTDETPGRFQVRGSVDARVADFVAVEPVRAPRVTLDNLRTPLQPSGGVTPTGIAPLDALIRLGGTAHGGLNVFVAQDKNCKTLTMLQVAEHRTNHGRRGVWIARDENAASIQKRRWQYRGDTEADAEARVARGDIVNDALVVTSAELDEVLSMVTDLARSGPVDVYLDSLNGDATSQHEIDELVRRLKATGADVFVTAEGTASRAGPMRVKGSTGVAFKADLTVALRYVKGDGGSETLTMRVARSRIANDGEVVVKVNTAGQRFAVASLEAQGTEGAADVRAAIVAAVKAHGPLSARGIERWVRGASAAIRSARDALVADGVLIRKGGKYGAAK